MRVKISITLSEELLAQIDQLAKGKASRSAALEHALREFFANRSRRKRDEVDLGILNSRAEELNREASEVLEYQVEA